MQFLRQVGKPLGISCGLICDSERCLCSTILVSHLILSASRFAHPLSSILVFGFVLNSQSMQVLAECARASTRGAAPSFRSASNDNRVLLCAMQLGCGQYFMHTLSPLFASVVMGNGVGAGDMSIITTLPPPPSPGRTGGGVDSSTVAAALVQVLSCIIDGITHAPMWLRRVCGTDRNFLAIMIRCACFDSCRL